MILLNCLGKKEKEFCSVSALFSCRPVFCIVDFSVMTYPKPLKTSVLVLVKTSSVLLKLALANVKAFRYHLFIKPETGVETPGVSP